MQLINEFSVDAPLDAAWSALTDIPLVIGCVPGAELEDHDGDDYRARVGVKVGPVGLTLAGTATVVSRDNTTYQMVVRGAARDRKGQGSAEAVVRISARDDAGRAHVTVRTDLELGGRISQFGGPVISQVSNRIIGQFVTRLNAAISTPAGASTAASAPTSGLPVSRIVDRETDWTAIVLTAVAGVALGLALGRTAERVA